MDAKDILESLIKYSGYTASEFAIKVGSTPATFSNIKSGHTKMTLDLARKIKKIIPQVSYDFLLGDTDVMFETELIENKDIDPILPIDVAEETTQNESPLSQETQSESVQPTSQSEPKALQNDPQIPQFEPKAQQIETQIPRIEPISHIEKQNVPTTQCNRTISQIIILFSDGTYEIR